MSSRSNGVTKVELRRLMMSWVIRSPSCSDLRISRFRPSAPSGQFSSISWSSSAERTAFWPDSVRRSKKTRSLGAKLRLTTELEYRSFGRGATARRRDTRNVRREPLRGVAVPERRRAGRRRPPAAISAGTSAIRAGSRPSSVLVPGSIVIGRSVLSRSVKQGTPR